jgi:hypothetical protein
LPATTVHPSRKFSEDPELMKPSSFFKTCKFYIWKKTFAIVKAKRIYPDAFANIIDKNEITVVIEEEKVDEKEVIDIEKGWKVLSFDMVLPLGLTGFLAAFSKVLADEGISIYAISAYSTDHILMREKDVAMAKKKLKKIGCKVVKEKVPNIQLREMLK